ncbi:MAG: hypothetical protein Q4F77_04735 [Acinetobacter sp.]|nr:hypothetical protein [Acinetobacter sp.]MDO5542600.1 hypothetical protein [Acinetobacter sp.]
MRLIAHCFGCLAKASSPNLALYEYEALILDQGFLMLYNSDHADLS